MLINIFETDKGVIVEVNPLCSLPEKKNKVKAGPILVRAEEIHVHNLLNTPHFPRTLTELKARMDELGGFELLL